MGGVSLRQNPVFPAPTPLGDNVDQPRKQLLGWASPGLWYVPRGVVDSSEGLLQEIIGGLANHGASVPDPTKTLPLPTAAAKCLIFDKSLARSLPGVLRVSWCTVSL